MPQGDVAGMGRALVAEAEHLLTEKPLGIAASLACLKDALYGIRAVQQIHRAGQRAVQQDEVHRLRHRRERTLNKAAESRATRDAALMRKALEEEHAATLKRRHLEAAIGGEVALPADLAAQTELVKARAALLRAQADAQAERTRIAAEEASKRQELLALKVADRRKSMGLDKDGGAARATTTDEYLQHLAALPSEQDVDEGGPEEAAESDQPGDAGDPEGECCGAAPDSVYRRLADGGE